jgi:ubiquitin carboxyl-terminal hydrolase L3
LQSNPAVLNAYARKMGLPEDLRFYDLLSTDDWALEMIPRPVYATLMLFPIKPASEEHRRAEAARIAAEGGQSVPASVYYTKQTIPNACGTIGVLHACANASTLRGGPLSLREGSFLDRFVRDTAGASADERAARLEADTDAEESHGDVVAQGQSAVVEDTWNHFVAFVEKEGSLFELDGRKDGPINHGPTTPETLLEARACMRQQPAGRRIR